MNDRFESLFERNNFEVKNYITRPGPFNSILWSAVVDTDLGYYYVISSLLDQSDTNQMYFISKNQEVPSSFLTKRTIDLISYTKNYYTIEPYDKGILVHDLRYGFLGDPFLNGENFVFSYELVKNSEGVVTLSIKNPRPKNTRRLLSQAWTRLKGI